LADPIACAKCGGCKAYATGILCLFCEDGVECPCGGWKQAEETAVRENRAKKIPRVKKIIQPKTTRTLAKIPQPEKTKSLVKQAAVPAPEVRPVFDGDFLERGLREFYDEPAASERKSDSSAAPPIRWHNFHRHRVRTWGRPR
jgi:hypothetical protein